MRASGWLVSKVAAARPGCPSQPGKWRRADHPVSADDLNPSRATSAAGCPSGASSQAMQSMESNPTSVSSRGPFPPLRPRIGCRDGAGARPPADVIHGGLPGACRHRRLPEQRSRRAGDANRHVASGRRQEAPGALDLQDLKHVGLLSLVVSQSRSSSACHIAFTIPSTIVFTSSAATRAHGKWPRGRPDPPSVTGIWMTYCSPCASSTPKAPSVARKHYCIPPLERVNARRAPGAHRAGTLLRAARAAPDGQDLRPARAAGPARGRRRGRLPLRVRERRGGPGGARRRGARHARHPRRNGRQCAIPGRRVSGRDLVRRPGEIRRPRPRSRAGPLVPGRPETPGAADRRDRLADRRYPDRGVLRQLRAGYVRRPAGFPQSVVLCGVRDVRDYRIHSSTEKAVVTGGSAFQHPGRIAAPGGLHRGRGARPGRPAHRRDGTGVHRRGAGDGVGADAGPAMAGQCAVRPRVLRGTRRGGTARGPSPRRR